MTTWMLAHPWMTFFIAMASIEAIKYFAKALYAKWSQPLYIGEWDNAKEDD